MGFFDWLRRRGTTPPPDDPRVAATLERITALDPQLRMVERYRARLAPAAGQCVAQVEALVASMNAPREASAAAWSSDAAIHAFFATPADVAEALSRSRHLQVFFDQHPLADEVCAVLGMAMTERRVLGVAQVGEHARPDVAQTTVSFGDHQVRICAQTDAELRSEIVRRVVDQLVLDALAGVEASESRRDALAEERALLKARLQLLERQGAGMRHVLGGGAATDTGELARVQAQLEENDRSLASLGSRADALERKFEHVLSVLAAPQDHLESMTRRLRLDRMNVVLTGPAAQTGEEIEIRVARIPADAPEARAFALVRFARANLLPRTPGLDDAARFVI
jgi:hypothetical protein